MKFFKLTCWCLCALLSIAAYAADPIEFRMETKISAPHSNDPDTKIFSVNQQLMLTIDLQTTRWFSAGTQIAPISVPNLIMKQTGLQAANFSRQEGGKTWAHQLWSIPLYPQATGKYEIPPIAIDVQVTNEDGRVIKKTLMTKPLVFQTQLPDANLNTNHPWVVSPNVELSQDWSLSNDEMKVGDSITRTVTVTAQDTMAILLPDLLNQTSTAQISSYSEPSALSDTQNRGDFEAKRVESETYVIQQGGELTLPDIKLTIWDPATQSIKTKTLEGKTIALHHTPMSWLKAYYLPVLLVLGLVVVLVLVWRFIHAYYTSHPKPDWYLFGSSLRRGELKQARQMIYQKLRLKTGELNLTKYKDEASWRDEVSNAHSASPQPSVLKSLWQQIVEPKQAKKSAYQVLTSLRQIESGQNKES